MFESNPPKSTMLVRGLAVTSCSPRPCRSRRRFGTRAPPRRHSPPCSCPAAPASPPGRGRSCDWHMREKRTDTVSSHPRFRAVYYFNSLPPTSHSGAPVPARRVPAQLPGRLGAPRRAAPQRGRRLTAAGGREAPGRFYSFLESRERRDRKRCRRRGNSDP